MCCDVMMFFFTQMNAGGIEQFMTTKKLFKTARFTSSYLHRKLVTNSPLLAEHTSTTPQIRASRGMSGSVA